MGIVTTASHPVFSFHCIPLFLFLPSFCQPNRTFACKFKIEVQFSGRGKDKI